jgi:hypothetical protein
LVTDAAESFTTSNTNFFKGIGKVTTITRSAASSSSVVSDEELLELSKEAVNDFNSCMSEVFEYESHFFELYLEPKPHSQPYPTIPTNGLPAHSLPPTNPTPYSLPSADSMKICNVYLPSATKVDNIIVVAPPEAANDRTVSTILSSAWGVTKVTDLQTSAMAKLLISASGPNRQEQYELYIKTITEHQNDKMLYLSPSKCGTEDFTFSFNGDQPIPSTSNSPSRSLSASTSNENTEKYASKFGSSGSRALVINSLRAAPRVADIQESMTAEVLRIKENLLKADFNSEHWNVSVSPTNHTTGGVTLTFTPTLSLHREILVRSVISKRLLSTVIVVLNEVTKESYHFPGRVIQVLENFQNLSLSTDLETVRDFDHADKLSFFAFLCWELNPSVFSGFSVITHLRAALHDEFGEDFFSRLADYAQSFVRDPRQPVSDWRREIRLTAQVLSQQQTPCGIDDSRFKLDIEGLTSEETQCLGTLCSLQAELGYNPPSTDLGRALVDSDWLTRSEAEPKAVIGITEEILKKVINFDTSLREASSASGSFSGNGGGGGGKPKSNHSKNKFAGDQHAQSAYSEKGSKITAQDEAIAAKVRQINGLFQFILNQQQQSKNTPSDCIVAAVKRLGDHAKNVFKHKNDNLILDPGLIFVTDIASIYNNRTSKSKKLDSSSKGQLDGIRMLLGEMDAPDYYTSSSKAKYGWGGNEMKKAIEFMAPVKLIKTSSSSSSN